MPVTNYLPGVIVNTLDGGLVAPSAPQDDSILILATAGQGPINTPFSVQDRTTSFNTFGAKGNWARHYGGVPNSTMLVTELEKLWATQQFDPDAISDPDRMTCLLERHFESLRLDTVRRSATTSKTCRSRLSL